MDPTVQSLNQLSDVSDTGLLTLFCRAWVSAHRPDVLVDPEAQALVARLRPVLADSNRRLARTLAHDRIDPGLALYVGARAARCDGYMREFIDRYPTGQVVNLACGLDTRFHRVALGSEGTRFEVDLEPVMALRDLLLGSPDGVRVVSSSVLNQGWMESLESDRPTLIIAEGLLMYLNTSEMRQLILSILHRLPGAEWVSDVVHRRWVRSPLSWLTSVNLHLRWGFGKEARFQSGLGSSKEMEAWNDELEFLGDWSFFDEPPSPLGWIRGFRRIRTLRSALWIIHYRLGCRAEGQGAV